MAAEDVNAFLRLLHGATQVAEGLGTVADAAGPVLATVDGVVNHLAAPATLERVAGAAVAAAAGAVVAEARAGAEMPSKTCCAAGRAHGRAADGPVQPARRARVARHDRLQELRARVPVALPRRAPPCARSVRVRRAPPSCRR